MEYMLWAGMPYRALELSHFGWSYKTLNAYVVRWARAGVFKEAYARAMRLQRRPTRRGATHNAIDTSYIKSIYGRDLTGRNCTDRGRRATKLSALVDSDGVVHSLAFFPGNTSDYNTVEATLAGRLTDTPRGTALYADKGYDSRQVREDMRAAGYVDCVLRRKRRSKKVDGVSTGTTTTTARKRHNSVAQRVANRRRGIVECVFAWIDKSRRLLVRYDALIAVYEAYTWLACLRILGRRLI
ncbi:hypothetical protein AB1Y20_008559 [Prymnesium parvum]